MINMELEDCTKEELIYLIKNELAMQIFHNRFHFEHKVLGFRWEKAQEKASKARDEESKAMDEYFEIEKALAKKYEGKKMLDIPTEELSSSSQSYRKWTDSMKQTKKLEAIQDKAWKTLQAYWDKEKEAV